MPRRRRRARGGPRRAGRRRTERVALGPLVSELAADYAALSLAASPAQVTVVLLGLVAVAGVAALWVARRIEREAIVAGLREE